MAEFQSNTGSPPLLLSVPAAARRMSMSARWMWERVRLGEIPSVRCGRARRIDPRDLDAWIQKNKSQRGTTVGSVASCVAINPTARVSGLRSQHP